MGYENRGGNSIWCQMQNLYHNRSDRNLDWPEYQPIFSIAGPDGTIRVRYRGNYYHAEDGWPNGIKGAPPVIPAGKDSFPWTWYSATGSPGEFCRYVAVTVHGVTFWAEYDVRGKQIGTGSGTAR